MSLLPLQGEVPPMTTNLAPNVGPMVCGHPVTRLPSKPSITISCYRVATQCPTSKVIQKSTSLTEKQCANVWHFPGAWLLAVECSDFVLIKDKLCPCTSPVQIMSVFHRLPNLPSRDIEVCGNQLAVFSGGTMVGGWLSVRRTLFHKGNSSQEDWDA